MMLQRSRQTLEELHYVCRPKVSGLWADPSVSLTRFGFLRSLTLHELPELVSFWLLRLPISLERLTIIAAPRRSGTSGSDNRSAVS